MDLTEIDYKILDFISKNEPVYIDEIKSEFSQYPEIEYRINLLERPKRSESGRFYIPNSSFITSKYEKIGEGLFADEKKLNIFEVTDLGKKALNDYKQIKKSDNRKLWLKNAWIPIIVAFVTTVLTNYLLPKLLHLIEWLLHIL